MFLPLLLVCSLQVGYLGDTQSGATCVKFTDATVVHYTLRQCETRVREMLDEVMSRQEKLNNQLPGPWRFHGKCVMEVINETRLG